MIRRAAIRLLQALAKDKPGLPPFAFHDLQGRSYYAWRDVSELPRMRRLEVDNIAQWIDAGRPESAISEITDAIRSAASKAAEAKDSKVRSQNLAAIFKLAEELGMRSGLVPEECIYALCAATCVREGEDPTAMDRKTHQEKIEAFRDAGRAGHLFFFTPTSKAYLGALYTTESAWQQRLLEFLRAEAHHRAVLKVTTSEIE
jgi:hypothetical protein